MVEETWHGEMECLGAKRRATPTVRNPARLAFSQLPQKVGRPVLLLSRLITPFLCPCLGWGIATYDASPLNLSDQSPLRRKGI